MASDKYNNDAMFDLYDINNDNIPELFISTGISHANDCLIYTVLNGTLQKLERYDGFTYGGFGTINCSSSIQTIFSSWSGMGCYFADYYKIQDNKFIHTLKAYNIFDFDSKNTTYKINDEIITVEEYNKEVSKYEADDYIEVGFICIELSPVFIFRCVVITCVCFCFSDNNIF